MTKVQIKKEVLENLYCRNKMNAYQIAKQLNCGSTTIYRKLEEFKIKRRDNSECHLRYNKIPFSGDKKEMAYLIGFRLGDLHVRKAVNSPGCKTVRVEAHTTKQVQINLMKYLFEKYTHVHCKSISNKTIRALCFLDESFSFLLPKKDEIESWIANDKDLFFSFLAGYTDAEGHFGLHKNAKAAIFVIQTQDKGIIHGINKCLTKFGIKSTIRLGALAGYCSPSYPNKPNNRNRWDVAVYTPNIIALLNNTLPFLRHEKRKLDALKVQNSIETRKHA